MQAVQQQQQQQPEQQLAITWHVDRGESGMGGQAQTHKVNTQGTLAKRLICDYGKSNAFWLESQQQQP